MTYYIKALVKDGIVSHVSSATDPITYQGVSAEADISVTCEVEGEYEFAADILPLLGWDGAALTGVNTLSQVVHVYPRP